MAAGARRRDWHRCALDPLRPDGHARSSSAGTALWYGALREAPVRFVVVRDPSGRRRDEAFFCTDLTVGVAFLLATYAKRWTLEVTFFDCKQVLGFEDPQNQTARAVRRTAPFAGIVYALVVLWAAQQVRGRPRAPLGHAPVVPPQGQPVLRRPAGGLPPGERVPGPPARFCAALSPAAPTKVTPLRPRLWSRPHPPSVEWRNSSLDTGP